MKKIVLITLLIGAAVVTPASAARSGRPPVTVTTSSDATPSVSPF